MPEEKSLVEPYEDYLDPDSLRDPVHKRTRDGTALGSVGVIIALAGACMLVFSSNLRLVAIGETMSICGTVFIAAQWRPR